MNALYRFTGSLAFVGAARAAYIVFKDKKDSDRRYFMPVKNNLGIDDSGFSYCVAADDQNRAFIQWDGEFGNRKTGRPAQR